MIKNEDDQNRLIELLFNELNYTELFQLNSHTLFNLARNRPGHKHINDLLIEQFKTKLPDGDRERLEKNTFDIHSMTLRKAST